MVGSETHCKIRWQFRSIMGPCWGFNYVGRSCCTETLTLVGTCRRPPFSFEESHSVLHLKKGNLIPMTIYVALVAPTRNCKTLSLNFALHTAPAVAQSYGKPLLASLCNITTSTILGNCGGVGAASKLCYSFGKSTCRAACFR